ncbi:MAG: DUF599 domain-containing protein [Euryarchaeota archaeon]|nr:DUF599 domain-containing protein [Euryarchaeota archaeon]
MDIDHLNMVALVIFFVATLGYHIGYNVYGRMMPLSTVKGKVHRYRKDWVENILQSRNTLLAVQAVRNQIMTTTWLASSVLLVLAFFLSSGIAGRGTAPIEESAFMSFFGIEDFGWLRYKIYLLLTLLGFAFLMFLFSLRHVMLFNTLIGVSPELIAQLEHVEAAEYLAQLANRSSSRFTYGLRATYFTVPTLSWLFSTWMFIITTAALWLWLFIFLDTRGHRLPIRRHPV